MNNGLSLAEYSTIKELRSEVARLTIRNVELKCRYKRIRRLYTNHDVTVSRSAKALTQIASIKNKGFDEPLIYQSLFQN